MVWACKNLAIDFDQVFLPIFPLKDHPISWFSNQLFTLIFYLLASYFQIIIQKSLHLLTDDRQPVGQRWIYLPALARI